MQGGTEVVDRIVTRQPSIVQFIVDNSPEVTSERSNPSHAVRIVFVVNPFGIITYINLFIDDARLVGTLAVFFVLITTLSFVVRLRLLETATPWWLSQRLGFLKTQTSRLDPVIHYSVVDALAFQENPRLISLFQRLLDSGVLMEGAADEGFPVRYAAAWALVSQNHDARRRTSEAVDAIASAAEHRDPRLAGPAIIALTMLGEPAHAALVAALSRSSYQLNAAILALISAQWVDRAVSDAVHQTVPAEHPIRSLLDAVANYQVGPLDEIAGAMKRWITGTPSVTQWLASILDGKDLHPALRFALGQITHDTAEAFVTWGDYRQRDLARSVPVLTTWQMAGGT